MNDPKEKKGFGVSKKFTRQQRVRKKGRNNEQVSRFIAEGNPNVQPPSSPSEGDNSA